MKTIEKNIKLNKYSSKVFTMYFGKKSFAVFDIETTGLMPSSCRVIISGMLFYPGYGDEGKIIQLFADKPDDEREIISRSMELLGEADFILTYNGRQFDVPFMQKRAQKHGLVFPDNLYDLDLYLVVNGHSNLREVLPSLSQKSVERYMGLADTRDDEISGGESVRLYELYMETKSFDLERRILLHNHDDLIQLYKLLPVIASTDFHGAMFRLGFPAGNLNIEKIMLKGRELHVMAKQRTSPADYISFPTMDRPYSLIMDSSSGDAEIIIPCEVEAGALYFDARLILGDGISEIENYPAVTNGYLVVNDNGRTNPMEINAFLLAFLRSMPG